MGAQMVGALGVKFEAANSLTLLITTTGAAEVGDTLLVNARAQESSYITAVSDPLGNTYSLVATTTAGNTASMFIATVTTRIPSGTVLTLTGSTSKPNRMASLVLLRGLASSPVESATATQHSAQTTVTSASVSPVQFSGVVVCLCTVNVFPSLLTVSTAGFTVPTGFPTSYMTFAHRINDETTAKDVSFAVGGTTQNWGTVIASLKANPSDFLAIF